MMSRSILNDLHIVDDTDEPNLDDLDPIGRGRETNDSVSTNIQPGSKETTTSTKTTGHSESVKMPRKRMAPRSKVWTEGHFIPVKDKDGNVIKEEKSHELKEEKEKVKRSGKKRRNTENRKNFEDEQANHLNNKDKFDEADCGKKKRKLLRYKKTENEEIIEADIDEVGKLSDAMKDGLNEQNCSVEVGEKKRSKTRQKKRKNEKKKKAEEQIVELDNEVEDGSNQRNGKSKKTRKVKKKDSLLLQNEKLPEKTDAEQVEVYEISSGDEDCSKGMKKWIMEYHQSRPGVEILQERIDDFIIAHEAQQEQERKEREARAAKGGWTVVVHHKGRKKTTDSESGVAVGSVAHAVVTDKMAKKKNKEVGLDFYRFQKREAQRNEIMMLQSKFEQDKKRIQQMRAARKFRPY